MNHCMLVTTGYTEFAKTRFTTHHFPLLSFSTFNTVCTKADFAWWLRRESMYLFPRVCFKRYQDFLL